MGAYPDATTVKAAIASCSGASGIWVGYSCNHSHSLYYFDILNFLTLLEYKLKVSPQEPSESTCSARGCPILRKMINIYESLISG
jgi:hypothetical protein